MEVAFRILQRIAFFVPNWIILKIKRDKIKKAPNLDALNSYCNLKSTGTVT